MTPPPPLTEKRGGQMLNKYPDVLTVEQLAQVLGVGKNSAYKLVNNRVIGHVKVGKKTLIPKACVIDYLESARYNVKM